MARMTAAPDRLEGYTQSKLRISTLPPIPCCDHCRRPSSNPHAPECPNSDGAPPVGWMATGGSLAEWAEEQKRRRAEPPVPSPVYEPEPEPCLNCAECGSELPYGRPKFCTHACSRAAFARIRREKRREETAPVTTATKTYPLSVLDDLVEPEAATAEETAVCTVCGTQPRIAFATKLNGDPWAVCKVCRSAQAKEMAAKRTGIRRNKPIPQEVADVAYAPMTQAPDPEDMIPTKPVARFLPEPAVIDQAAQAPASTEPSGNPGQLPPIEDEIARAEQQLRDLMDVRKIMEDDLPALLRWQRLVGEAIARKRVTA
jgi:hypothetical protein